MPVSVDARALQSEIAALNDVKQRRRYGPELRRRLAAHARERLAAGDSVRAVSRALDVSPQVITRALAASTAIVPVAISAAPAPASSSFVVRAPMGVTIEGASLDDVAALIVRLSCSG